MSEFLLAESGIRQLHARCVDAVWRKDTAAFVDCYAEDGEWKIAGMHMRGRGEIGSRFEQLIGRNQRVLMRFGTPVLEVAGGTASGRTYTTEYVKRVDGQALMTIGNYYERFVEQGDRWRFQWRHFDLYYLGRPDLSEPLYECREYGLPPGMPGPDDPATFRQDEISDGA
jgi:ketosteroid isomerase-like protein